MEDLQWTAESAVCKLSETTTAMGLLIENFNLEHHDADADETAAIIFARRYPMYRAAHNVILRDLENTVGELDKAADGHYEKLKETKDE